MSANAVEATAGGWSTGSSASLTFPLHSHISSARREGSEYHFKSLWYDSAGVRTHDLPVLRQTLYHWAITPVIVYQCYISIIVWFRIVSQPNGNYFTVRLAFVEVMIYP